jgi:hypothetical protein
VSTDVRREVVFHGTTVAYGWLVQIATAVIADLRHDSARQLGRNAKHLYILTNLVPVLQEIQLLRVYSINTIRSRTCPAARRPMAIGTSLNKSNRLIRMYPLTTTIVSRSPNAHDPAKNLRQVNVRLRYCQGVGDRPLAPLRWLPPSSIACPADALERYPPSPS